MKVLQTNKQLRQTLQGMRGERITQSGISKGKDVIQEFTNKKEN
jgi:hypothetical protein